MGEVNIIGEREMGRIYIFFILWKQWGDVVDAREKWHMLKQGQ